MLDVKKTTVRALSGAVYVALIILACWWGVPGVVFLAGLFSAIGVTEFRKMHLNSGATDSLRLYNILGALALTLSFLPSDVLAYPFFILWLAWLIGRMIITIYSKCDRPEMGFATDITAQIYISLPLALLIGFALHLQSAVSTCMPILAMFILIWVNDTGAFLVGSSFGRHRLFERVSPKKSWEGFWGGLILCAIVGAIFGLTDSALSECPHVDKALFWTLGGIVVSIASTFGDLFESVIKRNLHLKDSGNLIPGHGGILDRIDSLLMVIPAVLIYYIIFGCII